MATDWSKYVYTNTSTPYLDSYAKYEKNANAQAKKDRQAMSDRETADLNKSNAGYDSTARQNYINYMQAQKSLPSSLNSLGIRGGASESSLIRLGSNYGSNVSQNESARNTALAEIRRAYAEQLAKYNSDLSTRLANAKQTAEENQLKWESEQADKDLQRFSGVIEGLYNDKASYLELINQLKASKDPNKDTKILLATHAMNNLAASSGYGGGGGGGYSRGYGGSYGGYGGGDDTVDNTPTVDVSEAMNNYRQQNYTGRSQSGGGGSSRRSYPSIPYYGGGYRARR